MISYSVYKVVHLVGVFMVIMSVGGLAVHVINGGSKQHSFRKGLASTHGIGMLISLVGGFGLLARLGFVHDGLPGWAIAKLAIWFVFGAMTGILMRKPQTARAMWVATVVLGGTAAYLANYKPF